MICEISRDPLTKKPVFKCDPEGEIIRSFIENELQEDKEHVSRLISILQNSKLADFEEAGNLYILTLKNNSFFIENLYDELEQIEGLRTYLSGILNEWQAVTSI